MILDSNIEIALRLKEIGKFVADVQAGKKEIDGLGRSVKQLGTAAKETGGGRSSHLGIMQTTMMQAKFAAAGFILSIGAGTAAVAKFGLSATAQLEQVTTGFTHMLKSKGAAKDLAKQLQDFADWTPFVTADVDKWAMSLIGIGAKAQQVIPIITALGDSVADMGGSPDQVNGAVVAIEQIAAKSKISAQELNQLADNMVFARDILAKGLGVSTGSLMQYLDRGGTIASSTAIPIILRGLQSQHAGGMRAQSQTISGLWSTFKDKLAAIIRADPDSPFSVAVRGWLQRLIQDMPAIQEWIRGWFVRLWDLGGTVKNIAGKINGTIQAALGSLSAAGASGGSFGVGQAVGVSVPNLFDDLFDKIDKWAGSVDWFDIGKSVGSKAIGFTFGFLGGLLDLGAWWEFLKKHWWDALLVIVSLVPVGKLLGAVAKVFAKVPLLRALAPWLEKAGEAMVKAGGPIWKMLRGLGGAVFRAFEREFPKGGALARHVGTKIYNAVVVTIPNLFRGMRRGFGPLVMGWIEDGFAWAFGKLANGGRWLKNNFLVKWFSGWAVAGAAAIVTAFVSAWDGLKSGASGLFSWLKDGFLGVVNGFIDYLNGALSVNVYGHAIGPQIGHVGAPKAARGGTLTSGGLVEVGDAGREILSLPRGASVIPLQRAAAMGATGGGEGAVPAFNLFLDSQPIKYRIEQRQDTATARL